MALLERLQILIDADAKGAIREFDKIGDQADRAAKRTEDRFQKVGKKLTSIGTQGVIGGTVLLGGLAKLATLSDEAEIQTTKLRNSIKGSDQVFKNNGKSITDLADALQQVTAVDGDDLIGAGSVLVGLGLTEDQVKTLLPLVADFSRKFSVDLPTAAKTVGKAIGGNAGALKRYGVNVDDAKSKTDKFGAVVDALGRTVGGFARAEGATFSGQVAILKNNLGDLGETVGKGAAGAFGDFAKVAGNAVGALNDINPAVGESVGRVGAVLGGSAIAAGGLAIGVGKLIEARKAFNELGKGAQAAGFVAVLAVSAGVAFQVAQSFDEAAIKSDKFQKSIKNLTSGNQATAAKGFEDLTNQSVTLIDRVKELRTKILGVGFDFQDVVVDGSIKVGDLDISLQRVSDTLAKIDKSGNTAALRVYLDTLKNKATGTGAAFDNLQQLIKKYEGRLAGATGAAANQSIAQRDINSEVQKSIDKYDRQNATLEGITKSTDAYAKNLDRLTKAYEPARKAAEAFSQQVENSTFTDDIAGATGKLRTDVQGLNKDLANLPKNFQAALDPFAKVSEAGQKSIDAVLEFGKQSQDYLKTLIASGAGELVPQVAAKLRGQLEAALKAAGVPPDQIDDYLGLAGLQPFQIDAALKVSNAAEELAKLQSSLDIFSKEIADAPLEVRIKINQALLRGDVAEANRLVDGVVQARVANVRVKVSYDATPEQERQNTRGVTAARTAERQGRPPRALGGPVTKSMPYTVNEVGPEMFVPSSNGFVMTASDSKRLVAGVEQMLAGSSSGVKVDTINIASTDPKQTAREVVRGLRSATYLMGR